MVTAIDIGNTNVKLGFFRNDKLVELRSFPSGNLSGIYSGIGPVDLHQCIVSSVKPLPAHIVSYLRMKAKTLLVLDEKTPLPVKLSYRSAQTLGRDRIAMAAAGNAVSPAGNIMVVSAGTCFTYNLVTKGSFKGGAISPGLSMRLQALHEYTAMLPMVTFTGEQPSIIGNNTESSILSGVVNGIIFEIEGYLRAVEAKHSGLKVFFCGGDSKRLAPLLQHKVVVEPELVLSGLNEILKFNVQK